MKFYYFICLIFISFFPNYCSLLSKDNYTIIDGKINSSENIEKIYLSCYKLFSFFNEKEIIDSSLVDKNGGFKFKFIQEYVQGASIITDEEKYLIGSIYIFPHDSIFIQIEQKDNKYIHKFFGKNEKYYNNMFIVDSLSRNFMKNRYHIGKDGYYYDIKEDIKFHIIDSLKNDALKELNKIFSGHDEKNNIYYEYIYNTIFYEWIHEKIYYYHDKIIFQEVIDKEIDKITLIYLNKFKKLNTEQKYNSIYIYLISSYSETILYKNKKIMEREQKKKIDGYEMLKKNFTGFERDIALTKLFSNKIHFSASTFADYDSIETKLNHYSKYIKKKELKESLYSMLSLKKNIFKKKILLDINLIDINGDTITLEKYKNNLLYIGIWATWCGPCLEQIPNEKLMFEKYKDSKDFKIIMISIDDDISKWNQFIKDKELQSIQLLSKGGFHSNIMNAIGSNAVPQFLVIGKNGKIIELNADQPLDFKLEKYINIENNQQNE
jgi:thiol-disulfide isomerase/thioredoxin